MVGFPEAKIPLAEAVLYIALAPKSNSAVVGIDRAMDEVKTRTDWSIPDYLKDAHYSGAREMGHGNGYLYPHDFGGWVQQRYLPKELEGHVYYKPITNGEEKLISKNWEERRNGGSSKTDPTDKDRNL